ncbi:MAG: FAD-dependent oxidoreductase, partial [Pseudomonadota bacterium]
IGLEAAAVTVGLGLETTLVEAAPRILGRVAVAETAHYFERLHRDRGVTLLCGVGVSRLEPGADGTRVAQAELTDGRVLPADLVIVGVGVAPETALAEAAGLAIDDGIAVDGFGATSDPSIYAAGDCASFPHEGRRMRLESVQNAIDQAALAARAMLGAAEAAYAPVPWFWSDQYDVKLQIAGLCQGADDVVMRQGAREGALSVWSFAGGALRSVDAMNDPKAYMIGKRWLEAGVSPDPARLADPESDLRALA